MISENALKILEKRYFIKDEQGNPLENADEMFRRVAKAVANGDDRDEEDFYKIMSSLEFLPNSPTLMNAGRPLGQLSACFVLPIDDSMEGIFDSVKNAALIHKSGGGTGFSFSRLRAKGSTVNSTGGVASGSVSFMKVFNSATEAVKQGGTRRGANMGMLRVDHPDIIEFIECKSNNNEINNFNISIAITDDFMKNINNTIFNKIVEMAWKNGEPGIIFIDEMNKYNPTPEIGEFEATNPCGEQPLLPYEACNLGSINLAAFVKDGRILYREMVKVIKTAVKFLDNVIDVNKYPLKEIEEMTKHTRKIGLGVMGWADMLIQLGISYNSGAALSLAEEVMMVINDAAHAMSRKLGQKKGYALKNRRNATVTTIAPTGTISIIAGVSSGIEPLFALDFERNQADMIMSQESKYEGVDKSVLVTAHDISPEWHVRMQAAFQKYTDNAVSKTINMPHTATKEDVRNAFLLAYELKCKGITVYRDGSRDNQPLSTQRKRPDLIQGFTTKSTIGCGEIFTTVNSDSKGVFEVFTTTGKGGGCPSQSEAAARLASLALREGVSCDKVVNQLKGIRCMSCKGQKVLSCPDAIGKAIEMTVGVDLSTTEDITVITTICSECGHIIEFEGGCSICKNCGQSKCG